VDVSRILIIEDERTLLETIRYNLRHEGHEVLLAADGVEGLRKAREERPDLVILDLMLPGLDGFELLRRLRPDSTVPVLVLTARESEVDRVVGLELGADDYLTKPFSMRELLARVKALLRRVEMLRQERTAAPAVLRGAGLEVDLARRRVLRDGREVKLKPREFDLLAFLAAHPGHVFDRSVLLARVWGYDYSGDTRTVDVHVRGLREKLGPAPDGGPYVETVWGVGYRFRE
jgi:two-component system OmpR family response regulator